MELSSSAKFFDHIIESSSAIEHCTHTHANANATAEREVKATKREGFGTSLGGG